MNRIFRVIFNQRRGEYIVSSEHSRSRGKSGKLKSACLAAGLIAAMGLLPLQASATTEITGEQTLPASGIDLSNVTGTEYGAIQAGAGSKLTINSAVFENNSAAAANEGLGGAIYVYGSLTDNGSRFEGNKAVNGSGGAIFLLATMNVPSRAQARLTARFLKTIQQDTAEQLSAMPVR